MQQHRIWCMHIGLKNDSKQLGTHRMHPSDNLLSPFRLKTCLLNGDLLKLFMAR